MANLVDNLAQSAVITNYVFNNNETNIRFNFRLAYRKVKSKIIGNYTGQQSLSPN